MDVNNSQQKLSKDQIERFYKRIMDFSAAKDRAVAERQKKIKEDEEKEIKKPGKVIITLERKLSPDY